MSELLRIENLSAGYGEAVVLHDVAFSLGEGQTMALLGRNGTGKTTLINTLAGATRQHGGTLTLGGQALHKLAPHQRAAVGLGGGTQALPLQARRAIGGSPRRSPTPPRRAPGSRAGRRGCRGRWQPGERVRRHRRPGVAPWMRSR